MTIPEKIKHRFPPLAAKLYGFAGSKKSGTPQDMLLCAGVSLASAFYEFESFFLPEAVELIKNTLVFLMAACWIWCAFLNGFWKKYSFLVFMFLFWLIPRFTILLEENTGIRNYSKYLDAAAQFSRLISQYSLRGLSVFLNTPLSFVLPALFFWCVLFFIVGRIMKNRINKETVNILAKK